MKYTLSNLSKYINWFHKRKNHTFRNRYGPTIIGCEKHLINVIRYIYQNPVRAGIVSNPFAYPYSSLGFYAGTSNSGLFLQPDKYTEDSFCFGAEGREQWLALINDPIDGDDISLIRTSLKKREFKFSKEQLLRHDTNKSMLVI